MRCGCADGVDLDRFQARRPGVTQKAVCEAEPDRRAIPACELRFYEHRQLADARERYDATMSDPDDVLSRVYKLIDERHFLDAIVPAAAAKCRRHRHPHGGATPSRSSTRSAGTSALTHVIARS